MHLLRTSMRVIAPDAGLTLIEAMIALAIAGILLSLAAPAMRGFLVQNRLAADTSQLVAALTLARSEAIQRGRGVQVCRSIDADTAAAACSAAATAKRAADDWGAGWLVLVADSGQILSRQGALDDSSQVAATRKTITYHSGGNASSSFAKLAVSHNGEFARTVCISITGRISVKPDTAEC
jgi:type IV fimbrial biogenesis protein FimT